MPTVTAELEDQQYRPDHAEPNAMFSTSTRTATRSGRFQPASPSTFTRENLNNQTTSHAKESEIYMLKVCRGLMMYGAPTHRLEEYMAATADVLNLHQQSFYVPGLMLVSLNDAQWNSTDVHIIRCQQALNLAKLYQVHKVYKDVIHNKTSIREAIDRLDKVFAADDAFPLWFRVIIYGFASMCIGPVSYQARPVDLPMIFLLGCLLGFSELILAANSELYSHIFEIFCTIIISFLARALGSIHLPKDQNFCFSALCQASLVMILPGFAITNSALELQSKNMVAGSVRMVSGIIFTLFLAFGITIGTTIYGALDSGAPSATTCDAPWPFWWQILFVPIFTLAWIIVNQAPWRKMPAMILLTVAGWVVNHFSVQYFSANTTIAQVIGALTIGLIANLYSRLGSELAAAMLHPAIFIQVPGSLAANGGLLSGIQNADRINKQAYFKKNEASSTGVQETFEMLYAGYSMIQIAIGITLGLSVSVLLVYPFRKKNQRKSGLFSF